MVSQPKQDEELFLLLLQAWGFMWQLLKVTRAIDRSKGTLQSPQGAVLVCAVVIGTLLIPYAQLKHFALGERKVF